jgi:hypothetical protein
MQTSRSKPDPPPWTIPAAGIGDPVYFLPRLVSDRPQTARSADFRRFAARNYHRLRVKPPGYFIKSLPVSLFIRHRFPPPPTRCILVPTKTSIYMPPGQSNPVQ